MDIFVIFLVFIFYCVSLPTQNESIMKHLFILIILTATTSAIHAQKTNNIKEICNRVDVEISHWPDYMAKRQARIDSLKTLFYQQKRPAQGQFDLCNALIDEYCSFQNDSALYYCKMLSEIAPWTKNNKKIELAKIKMARQAVKSGMYEAAMNYFAEVDTTVLGIEEMTEYWRARHFAYVDMSAYCYIWDKRNEYLEEERCCREHLFKLLPENNAEWLMFKAYDALIANHFEEAEAFSDKCMKAIRQYDMLYRNAAFHRRFICESLHKDDEACYWLAECAITELRQGMTDQIGLWSLASKMDEKDLDKSYEYIRFSWDAISLFGVNTRSWQIAPVLSNIEHQYQAEKERLNRIISYGIVILVLMVVLLAFAFYYVNKQRKKLAVARQQLQESNNLLQERNNQLATANSSLFTLNNTLTDANRSKEEYIVQLLAYNSDFIDKKEEERRMESKMLRSGKMKELTRLLNSADKTNRELGMLMTRFDEIFLGLYPSFIEDFNALLSEEGKIKTSKSGHLNTPLRIFALLRLGIDKIPDVAKILHCSPQTIYNYRNNLRNAYIQDRNGFEEAVRSIGIDKKQP